MPSADGSTRSIEQKKEKMRGNVCRSLRCGVAAVSPQVLPRPVVAILLVLCAMTGHLGSCAYDYAVQPQAVNFTTIPKSQTVIQGGTVTLNCSCPIVKLGSNYPVPHLEWWKNGTRIREPEKPTKDDIRRGYLVSELVIEDASEGDEGYYECIAVDGKRKGEKKGPGNHVVSSPRAYVQVVSVDDFHTHMVAGSGSILEPQYGTETVSLEYGEPYVIQCDLGVPGGISHHILWYQNGSTTSRNTVLSNGSLLLPAATPDDSGLYQCSLLIGDTSIDSQTLHLIQVTQATYQGHPYLYADTPHTLPLPPGATQHILFYILGAPPTATPLTVEIRKNGEWQFSGSPNLANAPFKQVYVFEAGQYDCILSRHRDGNVISNASVNVVQGYVTETEDVYEVTTEENNIALRCGVPGGEPYQLVYWYKNRQPLAVGQVDYNLVGYSWEIEGVYQCFVVTATGVVNQTTWRVFNNRFTNPPTNVHCSVRFKDFSGGNYFPLVKVTWSPPDFIVNPGAQVERFFYEAFAERGLEERERTYSLSVEFDLEGIDDYQTIEEVYAFSVRYLPMFDSEGNFSSAPARCDFFNTVSRAIHPPLPIIPSCSSSYANFTWQNPLAHYSFRVYLSFLQIHIICLYSNHTPYEFEMSYSDDFYSYLFDNALSGEEVYYSKSLRTVDLTLTSGDSVPYGAVCTAYGKYRLDHGSITEDTNIPPVSCGTVASPWPDESGKEESIDLELVCSRGFVNMTWITPYTLSPLNISLYTSCFDHSDNRLHEVFSAVDAELNGRVSVTSGSILLCSFYGEFTDPHSGAVVSIPPVQCYRDQPSNMAPPPPPVTPPSTSPPNTPTPPSGTDVTPSYSTNTSTTTNTNYTIVMEVSIPSSVVIVVCIFLIIFIIFFLRCRTSSRYNAQRLHFSMEWELDKNYQPFNPEEIGKTISMETVYNNGEDWGSVNNDAGGDSPGCSEQHTFKLDTGTPSDSGTDPGSEGLKYNGATPSGVSSPVVVVEMPSNITTAAEDSGCGLQLHNIMSHDENGGKEHLFNRLLTGIDDDEITKEIRPKNEDFQTKLEMITRDERSALLESSPVSPNIAQMVADRLHNSSDSAVPSSGYGTADWYKFSTDTPQVTPEYLAQKLRDVEESELLHDDLLTSEKDGRPSSKTVSKIDLTLSGIINDDADTPNNLPSLLLTPPQLSHIIHQQQETQTTFGMEHGLGSGGGNLGTSASTGNLSSSYVQDNEGYLHVSSATDSSETHRTSFDTLAKSL